MKWQGMALLSILLASPIFAQESLPKPIRTEPPVVTYENSSPGVPVLSAGWDRVGRGDYLKGDRDFSNFIGFISNTGQDIDPRALTQIFPVFGNVWGGSSSPLPDLNMQAYGAGLSIALSDRLSFGMTKGAYVVATITRDPRLLAIRPELAGRAQPDRTGWLDLGGYVQYTLIRDVENQFIFTTGLNWQAPPYLAPYVTAGKEICCNWHVLATTGYQFPAGSGNATTNFFYGNIHIDRQFFGWLYPLVEFNWAYHTTNISDVNIATRRGVIDLGTVNASGNLVTVAPGFNAVLIRDRLEFGAVYETPISAQHNYKFNSVLVKMTMRY